MSDPLGLTEEQRMQSDMEALVDDLLSGRTYARNVKMITDLPEGSTVTLNGIPYTREHLLELIA